ncbi:MAG: GNAT family N-acetyltransferase [Corynebacterium sp.]|uniref:GNAT family N-acetyltransferase n=1 Tax=Corynebacterium sp. TaxID=1720 RepID=UPI0026DD7114|nr:GNAT family N-acetyltransferase [Corynebacterium sp.]MDO4760744.1 GNAT family N-acetyltransferase [Corynebacterium sp.]
MTVFFQFETPAIETTHFTPTNALISFVFSGNIAAQDITGDTAHSTTDKAVFEGLKHSPNAHTYILVAVEATPELILDNYHTSELGYPIIAAHCESQHPQLPDDATILGYIDCTALQQSQTSGIDVDVTLDAELQPLPGEPLDAQAHSAITTLINETASLCTTLKRSIIRVWRLSPLVANTHPQPLDDIFHHAGYQLHLTEHHGYLPIPAETTSTLCDDYQIITFNDRQPPHDLLQGYLALINQAETDIPTGDLISEPAAWTEQRLCDAVKTSIRRKNQHITCLLMHNNEAVGYSEVTRIFGSQPNVADQGTTLIRRDYRGKGLGAPLKKAALIAAQRRWNELDRVYTDIADTNAGMLRINQQLGFVPTSAICAWEKRL